MMTSSHELFSNTETHRQERIVYPQWWNYSVNLSKTADSRAFSEQWQRSTTEAEKQALTKENEVEKYYNQHSHSLPDIGIGSHVAIQNSDTKQYHSGNAVPQKLRNKP